MAESLYVYFSRPNDTVDEQPPLGPIKHGPFDFVQLTYYELRVGPDGDHLAWMDNGGEWRVKGDPSETDKTHWYSDVVVSADGNAS